MKLKLITNFSKVALTLLMTMGLFFVADNKVYAEEIAVQESIDFIDEYGNVVGTFVPYSEDNPAPVIMPRAAVSVDTSLSANSRGYLSNIYSFTNGQKINLNITISPQNSSNIGLYNRDTATYGWPSGGLSSSGWYGTLEVSGSGKYSLALQNNSTTSSTSYKGSYSF